MDSVITLSGFGAAYGEKTVLDGVSLEIKPNRITAVLGASGCGKSTLLSAMNGMLSLKPGAKTWGEIRLWGQELSHVPAEELRRRVGMVFQSPTPFPFSIRKNMTYAPLYYGVKNKDELDEIVKENLLITGLYDEVKEELGKSALALSGGQQQRLCIARALTARPEVLLLDEPCSALDAGNTRIIEELLVALKERYTIVIVTHNLMEAKRIADDCVFLGNGTLIETGSMEKLLTAPEKPETREYLRDIMDS